jgi:hypothetical protein
MNYKFIGIEKRSYKLRLAEDIPSEVVIEDKTAVEQLRLIQQLEDEDRQTIFKLIDMMLTNKKFKDFFQKNVAAL